MPEVRSGEHPELSFAIPCYNEEANVVAMYQAVTAEAERHAASHEILFIDNDSTDRTRPLLREICAADGRVRAIFNNRNYGQMRSPTYAIYQAEGAAVIGLCCDFQDPPALIGEMVRRWREGAQIVLGQRRTEKSSWMLSASRAAGYGFLGRFADYPVLPGVTGFGLYDREVVDMLASWNEPEPFLRGMAIESGYRFSLIPFDRPQRAAGETKNNFRTLLSFALSGLAGSAKNLLRLPLILSVYMGAAAGILLVVSLVRAVMGASVGVPVMLTVLLGLFAALFLFLGLMGDQIRLLTERTRGVPLVIEGERVNFPPARRRPAQRTAVKPLDIRRDDPRD